MEGYAVAFAVTFQIFSCDSDAVVQILIGVGADDGSHLFAAQRICCTGTFSDSYDDFRAGRNIQTSQLSDLLAVLTNGVSVGFAVLEEGAADFLQTFLIADDNCTVCFKFLQDLFKVRFRTDDALLCRADDTIIIGAAFDDFRNSFLVVIAFIDNALYLSCANDECRRLSPFLRLL